MHETYAPLTLGEFIAALEALGDQAQVRGLNGDIRSYRGYYERNATAPCDLVHHADFLAKEYRREVGKDTFGWKCGTYTASEDELIYYADIGETGPQIVGFRLGDDGVYELILVKEVW